MSLIDRKIKEGIYEIAHPLAGKEFAVYSGTVVAGSVDETANTCSVVLSVDDASSPTTDVMLSALAGNANGLISVPADGSVVMVAAVDGQGKYGIVQCSEVVKVKATIGSKTLVMTSGGFKFNGGSLHGMVKVDAVVSKLNRLENVVGDLITKYNSHVHSGGTISGSTGVPGVPETGSVTPATVRADLENGAVLQ